MSRFLDERGRFFGKVNVVDLVVLLVVVAVVVFAVMRTTGGTSTVVPVRVTFTVAEVREATVKALRPEGTVRDEGGTTLGQIVGVTARPTLEEYVTSTGELKALESPIFSDVDIVVLGEGRLSGSTVRIGSVPMRVGKKVTLVGPGFEVQTVITGVLWGEAAG